MSVMIKKIIGLLNKGTDSWVFLLRLTLAVIFIQTGWAKLHHLPDVTMFFESLGIPFPHYNALFISSLEFVGGIALILGLGTRLFAALLASTMVVAIITAQLVEVQRIWDIFGLQEWNYLVMFGILVFYGAGKLSVDAILNR